MTSDQEWVRERADALIRADHREPEQWPEERARAFAALQEAVDRTRMDAQEKAVAAERERLLARLANPDEAMVEVVGKAGWPASYPAALQERIRAAIRALAAHLDKKEKADG